VAENIAIFQYIVASRGDYKVAEMISQNPSIATLLLDLVQTSYALH